ncbi:MAG: hypothetical protein ACSHXL_07295 [Bacteroidota bacterium]
MERLIDITGIGLILLALAHAFFPKYFKWKEELVAVSPLTRQIFYVHTFFVALMVLLMGVFCLMNAEDIKTSLMGKQISGGFAVFWGCRLLIQFFGYSAELWRGKKLETIIHVLFSIIWLYLTVIFAYLALC